MKNIAVFVATTQGSVQVERITNESAPQSVVCLHRSSTVLPISSDYDDFVRSGSGIIQREFGDANSSCSYRIDLSGNISSGKSWQLGFFVAHFIDNAEEMSLSLSSDEADQIYWISGEVDYDLNIGEIHHVKEKIASSMPELTHWTEANVPVTIFLPYDNQRDLLSDSLPDGCDVQFVKSMKDALGSIGLDVIGDDLESSLSEGSSSSQASRSKWFGDAKVWGLGLFGVVVFAIVWMFFFTGSDASLGLKEKLKTIEAAPVLPDLNKVVTSIKLFERRAPKGKNCAEVYFGSAHPDLRPVAKISKLVFFPSKLDGLCGLSFRVDESRKGKEWTLNVISKGKRFLLPSDNLEATSVKGQQVWDFDLPKRLKLPVKYEVNIVSSSGDHYLMKHSLTKK